MPLQRTAVDHRLQEAIAERLTGAAIERFGSLPSVQAMASDAIRPGTSRCSQPTKLAWGLSRLSKLSQPWMIPPPIDDVLVDLIRGQHAGHGERFAVLEGIRQAGEEVAGCRHDFVAYRGVEVTDLDLQVVVGHFGVELGKRQAVEALGADLRRLELAARFQTGRRVEAVVGAAHHVSAPAEVPTATLGVGGLLGVDVQPG